MALLNSIKRRSGILILIIGIALAAFLLGDLFSGGLQSFTTRDQNLVGELNGEDLTISEYNKYKETNFGSANNNISEDNVWNSFVNSKLQDEEFNKLGINISNEQVFEFMADVPNVGQNPQFQTGGVFDPQKLKNQLALIRTQNPEQFNNFINYMQNYARGKKSTYLRDVVKAGFRATLPEAKISQQFKSEKRNIRYLKFRYDTTKYGSVNVSDDEIQAYINDHKEEFEAKPTRDIQYVFFETLPSKEDTLEIKNNLNSYLSEKIEFNEFTKSNDTLQPFGQVTADSIYVNLISELPFNNDYVKKDALSDSLKSFVETASTGQIKPVYFEDGYGKLSKFIGTKSMADSAKCRHILIAFQPQDTAKSPRTPEVAKALADSLLDVVKSGKSIESLAAEFSDDPGSKDKEGFYDWAPRGQYVPTFEDFVFNKPVGEIGVVETPYGYHVIKNEGQKAFNDNYKIATIAKKIFPSTATENKLFNDAKSFKENITKAEDISTAFETEAQKLNMFTKRVEGLEKMSNKVEGVPQTPREIVRWAFDSETKLGSTKQFNITEGKVIAVLTAISEEETQSVEEVRQKVEKIIFEEKLGNKIKDQILANKYSTLDEAAEKFGLKVKESEELSFDQSSVKGAGTEPKVVGASFGLEKGQISTPVLGQRGVFLIEVTEITEAIDTKNYDSELSSIQRKLDNSAFKLTDILKKNAEIEDYRFERGF